MSPSSFYDDLRPGFGGKCWQVHKFGGTSVADANCFIQVAEIIEDQIDTDTDVVHYYGDLNSQTNLAVVLSAMGGKPKVTDLLLDAVRFASLREHDKVDAQLNIVREKHRECLEVLFQQDYEEQERLIQVIEGGLHDIRDILKTVSLMKWKAERISGKSTNELIFERSCTQLILTLLLSTHLIFRGCLWLRGVMVISNSYVSASKAVQPTYGRQMRIIDRRLYPS